MPGLLRSLRDLEPGFSDNGDGYAGISLESVIRGLAPEIGSPTSNKEEPASTMMALLILVAKRGLV